MKIELNTITREIKEIPTKKEVELNDNSTLQGDILTMYCAALAYKINQLAADKGQRDKLTTYTQNMIKSFVQAYSELEDEQTDPVLQ